MGKVVNITTGGINVPNSIFSVGNAIAIVNFSTSSQTISSGAGITMYLGGTNTTGNRTLAQYGLASVLCVSGSNTFIVVGQGLT